MVCSLWEIYYAFIILLSDLYNCVTHVSAPLGCGQVENGYTLLVPIFKQFHTNIIGKGGANITKVRKP